MFSCSLSLPAVSRLFPRTTSDSHHLKYSADKPVFLIDTAVLWVPRLPPHSVKHSLPHHTATSVKAPPSAPSFSPYITYCCLFGSVSVFMAAGSRRKTAVSPLPSVKCLPRDCDSLYLIPLADHPEVFQQNPVRKEWEGCLPRTPHLSVVTFCGHLLSRRHDRLLLSQSVC